MHAEDNGMTGKIILDQEKRRGSRLRWLRWAAALVLASTLPPAQSPAFAEVVVPAEARAMTGYELFKVFRDKTWTWPQGAGRMQDAGRAFTAWSQSGDDAVWAEGRWIVKDDGQLCLKAMWHSPGGKARKTTCFSHRTLDGTIYQKKEPAGAWYIFKHEKPAKDDEFNRLISEDLVGTRLMGIQEYVKARPVQTNGNEPAVDTVRLTTMANEIGGTP